MVFEDQDDLGTDSSGHPGQDGGWLESRDLVQYHRQVSLLSKLDTGYHNASKALSLKGCTNWQVCRWAATQIGVGRCFRSSRPGQHQDTCPITNHTIATRAPLTFVYTFHLRPELQAAFVCGAARQEPPKCGNHHSVVLVVDKQSAFSDRSWVPRW